MALTRAFPRTWGRIVVGLMLALGWALGGVAAAHAGSSSLTYPPFTNALRGDYALRLMALALTHAGLDYTLSPAAESMTQARAAQELELGRVDFMWAGTSAENERRFRAIRVPVLRGLEGYRVCVINGGRQAAFSAVTDLDDLKRMSIGQGIGWSDVDILKAAGFRVVTGASDNLFAMTERDRFDCFLRGVHEAPGDVARNGAQYPALTVESDLMLVYPFASFFFVNKDNARLADALEAGLGRAYEDGSFMALFNSHPAIKAIVEATHMAGRRRFDIPNPYLTDETRRIPARYWQDRGPDG